MNMSGIEPKKICYSSDNNSSCESVSDDNKDLAMTSSKSDKMHSYNNLSTDSSIPNTPRK